LICKRQADHDSIQQHTKLKKKFDSYQERNKRGKKMKTMAPNPAGRKQQQNNHRKPSIKTTPKDSI